MAIYARRQLFFLLQLVLLNWKGSEIVFFVSGRCDLILFPKRFCYLHKNKFGYGKIGIQLNLPDRRSI